jgi:hypothetical protein
MKKFKCWKYIGLHRYGPWQREMLIPTEVITLERRVCLDCGSPEGRMAFVPENMP